MKLRHLFATLAGIVGASLVATSPASAAVTVMGAGLAQNCYKAAEFNGDPGDGVATCSLALEQQALSAKDRAATYVNRGILRARLGNTDAALADYDQGLAIRPALAEAYVDRGAVYIALKRYNQALTDIDKGISLGTKNAEIAYYDRAIAHEALGDIRAAYEDYRHAVTLAPNFTLAIQQLRRFKIVRRPASNGT